MKISILTATYNRSGLLGRLYHSIKENIGSKVDVQWLIMDDGSTDKTKEFIDRCISEDLIEIEYFYQENQSKITAINNLVKYATGDVIVECDSDSYFTDNAFRIIKKSYEQCENEDDLYAMCFLKYDTDNKNIGNNFKNEKTTMFDLYFKEGETGKKALVFFSDVRKKYKYRLEKKEKFVIEARMHHEMDLKYKIKCYNKPIMICEYQEKENSENIDKVFLENPNGYFKYFMEILQRDMEGVSFEKRLYVIKQYILFSYLSKKKKITKKINGRLNKFLVLALYWPEIIQNKRKYKI